MKSDFNNPLRAVIYEIASRERKTISEISYEVFENHSKLSKLMNSYGKSHKITQYNIDAFAMLYEYFGKEFIDMFSRQVKYKNDGYKVFTEYADMNDVFTTLRSSLRKERIVSARKEFERGFNDYMRKHR